MVSAVQGTFIDVPGVKEGPYGRAKVQRVPIDELKSESPYRKDQVQRLQMKVVKFWGVSAVQETFIDVPMPRGVPKDKLKSRESP